MPEKLKKVLLAPLKLLGLIFRFIGKGIGKGARTGGKWYVKRQVFGKPDKKTRKINRQQKKIHKEKKKIKEAKAKMMKLQDR